MKRAMFFAAALTLSALPCRALEGRSRVKVDNSEEIVEITMVEPSSAEARSPAPAEPQLQLSSSMTVSELTEMYISSMRDSDRDKILSRLGAARPRTEEDLRWLLDLFARDDRRSHDSVVASLNLLTPADQRFSAYFTALIGDKDAFLRAFGMIGALQLRSPEALPLIRAAASPHFSRPQPSLAMVPQEANQWRTHFQALQTLAAWEGRKALPLLESRSKEAPALGSVIATYYWDERLPEILRWSESENQADLARASAAWGAPVALDKVRATAGLLRSVMLDPKKKKETRHQAALKLGFAAGDAEAAELLKDYEAAADPDARTLLATALFASRSPRALPLLERYAKEDPTASSRAAALLQLREMLPKDPYRELLRWSADHDPDPENRAESARQLAIP